MTTVSLGKTQTNLTSLPHNRTLPSYMRETQSIYLKVILTSYHSLFFYSFSFLQSISSIMPCSLVTFLSSPSTLNEILTLLLVGMDVQLHEFTFKDLVPSVTISILKRLVVIWCQGPPITSVLPIAIKAHPNNCFHNNLSKPLLSCHSLYKSHQTIRKMCHDPYPKSSLYAYLC